MEGISHEAGELRRTLQARQAHRLLRRQPHHDRRLDRSDVHRRHGETVRGVRLAGAAHHRRQRSRRDRGARSREAQADTERPTLIVTKTHIGFGSPQAGHRKGARRSARRGERADHEEEPRVAEHGAVLRSAGGARLIGGRRESARREQHAEWNCKARRVRACVSGRRRRSSIADCRGKRRREAGRRRSRRSRRRTATSPAARRSARCSTRPRTRSPSWSADRPTSRRRTTRRSRRGRISRRRLRRRAICISAFENTEWASIMNGMAVHGGVIPYGGTFLIFSDYMRPAIRLAAFMKAARHLHLHARLDRLGRRRADASAHRATLGAAGDSEHDGHPAGRRE